MSEVLHIYEANAVAFDRDRGRQLMEAKYLDALLSRLAPNARRVLDVGCGTGEPIARYLIDNGCEVTGVDGASAMIAICADRFPAMTWLAGDMRSLALGERYDAIVAWDSFFHLTVEAQRDMFAVFREHAAPRALLLFTSGPEHGEAIGEIYGERLYHASLAADEYRALLDANGFDVLVHAVNDPDCGRHTVWLAQLR
jgi:predicted TPR repeat methyltransferase